MQGLLLAIIEIAIIVFVVRGFMNRKATNQARRLVKILTKTDKKDPAWRQAAETLMALYAKTPGRIRDPYLSAYADKLTSDNAPGKTELND